MEAAASMEVQNMVPMIISTPNYVTVDGLAVPIRPIPRANISYTHTDSSYSRMSQRSDCVPKVDESEEQTQEEPATETVNEGSPRSHDTTAVDTEAPDTEPETAPETVPAAAPPPTPPLHVLLIDDDPLTRLLMSRVSQQAAYAPARPIN